jgi:P-aminobenzoate N-oxygenase AurF
MSVSQDDDTRAPGLADAKSSWRSALSGTAVLDTDYDASEELMLRLYAIGKQRQWDSDTRLDWSVEVDQDNPLGMPDSFVWIAGSRLWDRLPERERCVLRRHTAAWSTSQLLHGEQFSLITVAKIAQTVPDVDAKLFAATQIMDEARHAEVFNRYLTTKIGIKYGLTDSLSSLFAAIMQESRWDFTALAVQIMIENLAMAIFTLQRDHTTEPLARAMTRYVMQDETRHVAFGRILLRKYYRDLTAAERREREEFVTEACWLLRDGFIGEAMWHNLDYGAKECIALAKASPSLRQYRRRLFMRIVPALKDINLFGQTVQDALEKMGVLGFAQIGAADSVAALDDQAAADFDRRDRAARLAEIEAMAALGGGSESDVAGDHG